MNKRILSLVILMLLAFTNAYPLKIYQTSKLEKDGTGSIKIIYSGKGSLVEQNKFIIGPYSFTEEMAMSFFSSATTNVRSVKRDYDVKDTTYYMTVEVDFTDLNKLSEARGFSNVRSSYHVSGDTAHFNYALPSNPQLYSQFGDIAIKFDFESTILSASGQVNGQNVAWWMNGSKSDLTKDFVCSANLKSEFTTNKEKKENDDRIGKCGTIGIELPLILSLGLACLRFGRTGGRMRL